MLSRQGLALFVVVAACGRTPVFEGPELLVQVVDEGDDAVVAAEVELAGTGDEPDVLARARTDGHGLATFAYPGNGTYRLHAATDLRCCAHDGSMDVTLLDPTRIVVLEVATGPCPTWVPPDC